MTGAAQDGRARIFMAPGYYVQGPGSLDLVGEKAASLGERIALICDADVLGLIGDRLARSFERSGLTASTHAFSGEITLRAVERLAGEAAAARPDVVVGAGGGKAIDAAKGVARRLATAFVSVPTIASTDAPASRGIVVYDDHHRPVIEQLDRNPDFVIVDTAIIAKAPARFLRAGIGDAISKKFEVEACWAAKGRTKHGTRGLRTARLIADDCYRVLREHGLAAMRAAERVEVTGDLEDVVEAIVLLSCIAYENGGLSLAHAVASGLGAMPGPRDAAHGYHVAYGTLVQMVFEERGNDEVEDLMRFLRDLGLPVSLTELGLAAPTDDDMGALAAATVTSPIARNQARSVDAAGIAAAIRAVERRAAALGRSAA